MQQMTYQDYTKWSEQILSLSVETIGVRIAIYDSAGNLAPEDIQQFAGTGSVQGDQRVVVQNAGGVDQPFAIQVKVYDFSPAKPGHLHQFSGWLEPQQVPAWIKNQR